MARLFTVLLIVVAALNLALSFAHLVEAPPRLWVWSPELWREATVFNGQFTLFAPLGAVLEIATILGAGALAWGCRNDGRGLRPALLATLFFAFGLGIWLAVVAPANAVLATWSPGPVPVGFETVRLRWEGGHIAITLVKVLAFSMLASAALSRAEALGALQHQRPATAEGA